MDNLFRTLPSLLQNIDSPEVIEAAVIAAWKQAAGEGLRTHAVPIRLEERVLVVAVADNVWQKQLSTMCAQLVFRVNSLLGHSMVDRIELKVAPDSIKHQPIEQTPQISIEKSDVPVDLWLAASAISDEHLRQTFLRAAMSATKRNERRVTR